MPFSTEKEIVEHLYRIDKRLAVLEAKLEDALPDVKSVRVEIIELRTKMGLVAILSAAAGAVLAEIVTSIFR